MGINMIKGVGRWVIPLPVPLEDDVEIIINGTDNLPFSPAGGTCAIYIDDTKLPISCTFTSSPDELDYILVINEPDLLPTATEMTIIHYGLSTNTSDNAMAFDLHCFSLV